MNRPQDSLSSDDRMMTEVTKTKHTIGNHVITSPYIICAAIWFNDGKKHEHQPINVSIGIVVAGRRHHNVFMSVADIKGVMFRDYNYHENIQGFLTSDDRFVNRKEAGKIAFDAGQISKLTDCLFSEDLY